MKTLLSGKDTQAGLEILAGELDVDPSQLTMDADFFRDLGADSLTMIEISMALEDRFGLTMPDERLERIRTVADVFELLSEVLPSPGN